MRFIGCKSNLLLNIEKIVNEKCKDSKIFCDIFSGTGTVGNYFKKDYEVISNDLLFFSYVLQKGTIEIDKIPKFTKLTKLIKDSNCYNVYDYLNNMDFSNYNGKKVMTSRYSPAGDRMYITEANALKIDCMRETVEEWYKIGMITKEEYYYLIACMIQELPSFSNISGTYGAYLKSWDKRALKEYKIKPLEVIQNGKNNKVYNQDGVDLLNNICGDILYVDPPYNARQYLPNYHLLETLAKYDEPEVKGITGVRNYSKEKSNWCLKTKVYSELEKLLMNAKFKHIIISYSSEGIMETEKIEEIMKKYCISESFQLVEIPYRRFKSRTANAKSDVMELLFYIEKEVL